MCKAGGSRNGLVAKDMFESKVSLNFNHYIGKGGKPHSICKRIYMGKIFLDLLSKNLHILHFLGDINKAISSVFLNLSETWIINSDG